MSESRRRPCFKQAVAALALAGVLASAAGADDAPRGRLSLIEENDGILGHQDRHYTQGLLIPYLSGALPAGGFWDRSFDFIGQLLPMYRADAGGVRRFEWQVLGQSEFTPTDIHLKPPDPNDRPYAAWLYTGFDWLQENGHHSLHSLEVQLGVVGPAALGEEIQNGYHAIAGFGQADGWRYQLRNRPAIQFAYDFSRRFGASFGKGYGVDAIPQAGLSLGTVLRYAQAGALLRFGNALAVDYGPERIRPALSGTSFFDARALAPGLLHFYVFAGVQGRRVFYNRFIDGAEELGPYDIGRKQEVADFVGGVSLFITRRFRADVSGVYRTREYTNQGSRDKYGSAVLTYGF